MFGRSLALNNLGRRDEAVADAKVALRIFEEIEDPNAEKVRRLPAKWRGEVGKG